MGRFFFFFSRYSRPRFQVSVYKTIGPLVTYFPRRVSSHIILLFKSVYFVYLCITLSTLFLIMLFHHISLYVVYFAHISEQGLLKIR